MKYLLTILFTLTTFNICHSETVLKISDRDVGGYWGFDVSRMNKTYPINVKQMRDRHGGEIQFKYTYLIDIDGIPKNFVFISAIPKSAEIEQKNLRKVVLFRRYQRNPKSDYKGATLVNADERWWAPGPKSL